MDFLTPQFLIFFIGAAIVSYKCQSKHRNLWLLAFSLYFYYRWNAQYFIIVVALIFLTFFLGKLVSRIKKPIVYALSSLCILSILIYFKYSQFIVDTLNRFILWMQGSQTIHFSMDLLLPLGISFMTFQALSYLGDIYYSKIEPEHNFINVALFICYFPNVTSGPIQKAHNMLPELKKVKPFHYDSAVHGASLFAFGALQKYYISDKLFPIVTNMLRTINDYEGFHYLFFAFIYAIYIYSNFNSYSDMAIGVSQILGINLSQNFRRPYLSRSIKEFWQRWHISLNSWFVDYIYIPLGGSRKGKLRKYLNIIIVFFISGLWHGASFHFIAWGLMNAVYQIIGDLTQEKRNAIYDRLGFDTSSAVVVWLKRAIVFYLISLSWIFFAVPGTIASLKIIKSMLFPSILTLFDGIILSQFSSLSNAIGILISVSVFGAIQILREKRPVGDLIKAEPKVFRFLLYSLVGLLLLIGYFSSFSGYGNGGFVYGDF